MKVGVGVRGTLPEFLTLFQTKMCDFPYPISDLDRCSQRTKDKKHNSRPWAKRAQHLTLSQ